MKNNKTLLIFPPQWMPVSPHFALPTLLGQYEDTGLTASGLDLNVDFYNKILTSDYVNESIDKAKAMLPILKEKIKKYYVKNKNINEYEFWQQNEIAKASMIDSFLKKYSSSLNAVSLMIEKSVQIFKTADYYYNPKLFLSALKNINMALEICSMPFYPTQIGFSAYTNKLLKLNYDCIKYYIFDKNTNIYTDYFYSVLEKIKEQDAKHIGISINSSSQIIAGLTLANILKKETDSFISIGGNHFGRVADSIEKYPEFFELFCDALTVMEGEIPVIELSRYVNGEIPIEKVPNLYYLKDNKVCSTEVIEPKKLNDLKCPSLDGYDLKAYFAPEIVMPFPASRGCYWRKCSFCDHDFGLYYNVKSIDKLIKEIKTFKEKYNISKFEFIDEAISPAYMEEMSKRIIKEGLDINYFCDARIENGFTKEVLNLAQKSGLRMILWGFESGSKRIMKLINKGIDIDNRLNIMRDASECGIYNFAFIFFGFPAETKQEAIETIDMICANTDIIHSYGKSVFTMGKHTKLRETPEKYGVVGEPRQVEEFSPTYNYEAVGMTKKELDEVINLCTKRAYEAYGNVLSFHLISREILFLYLCRYDLKQVCDFKLE